MMMNQKVEFKVAMDAEQAKLKNHKLIKTTVELPPEVTELVYKAAMKSYVIDLQNQIRTNWDKYLEDGVPESVVFGQALYAKRSKVTVRQPTQEEIDKSAAAKFSKMTAEQIEEFVKTGKFPEGV